jgi:hypothetical protein
MTTLFDEEYSKLMVTFDQFINGPADSIIATTNGPIRSLAGIQRDILKNSHVQKIVDYPTKVLAELDASSGTIISEGSIVRVYKDPNEYMNGLYEVQSDFSLRKIDYMEVTNLVAETKTRKFSLSDIHNSSRRVLARVAFARDEIQALMNSISGQVKLYSNTTGKAGIVSKDFKLHLYALGGSMTSAYNEFNLMVTAVDTNFDSNTPKVFASWVEDVRNGNMILTIYVDFETPTTYSEMDQVMVEVDFNGLDRHNMV